MPEDFELLIESVVDYAFITYDLRNRITGWNVGAERTLGFSKSEVLGQSGEVIFTPEDREKGEVERELEGALRHGRATDERWHLRRDGSRFWASGVMTLLRDDAARPRGFAKVLRDLTERKHAEDALRASEERLRLFVENVRDHALFEVDPEGRIAGWNSGAESLFGYSQDEIIGQAAAVLFPPEDGEYARQELDQALAEGRVEDERWLVRRDGLLLFARWVTRPIVDGSGQLRGFAKVLRDETERWQMEQARHAKEQQERAILQGQVADTGAELDRTKDELRALTASLMTAQEEERRRIARELHDDLSQRLAVLEARVVVLRQQSQFHESMAAGTELLRQEIATLSDVVRSLSHRLHPSILDDLGLEPALRALVEEVEQVSGIPLRLVISRLSRPLPVLYATGLYRITQEALRNVMKHAPDSRVTIRLSHTPEKVHLSVEDDGPGFDPEAVGAHRGLGLVSMRERARLLGGTVTVRSAPGAGTQVHVAAPWPEL